MQDQHQWFCGQVEQHKTALYRLARSILRNDEDAKDAVGEAVCKAFAALPGLRERNSCKPWLMRITANEAYNILSHRRRVVSLEDCGREPSAPPPDGGLWPLVQALPDTLRAPVTLFYYDDLTTAEIAAVLGIREGAVRTRLTRGRKLLKDFLEKEDAI